MTDAVAHRGPDGEGIWLHGPVALGHRRLSIIDLSAFGRQPMEDAASGCVISFNGEIYNYLELRDELAAAGHSFVSGTDTEVILKAYAQWGETCVERFNGMWSFAIHDPRRNLVFCSRDRFGVKPFYYVRTAGAFAFGSEIRQLLPLLDRVQAEPGVLAGFLAGRVAEDTEQSFFAGVRKLPGGHNLIFDLARRSHAIRPYYRLAPRFEYAGLSLEGALESFAELFEDAVRLRLRSDVKVGTCLSGGMDSSAIATLAAAAYSRDSGQRFAAITAISEDPATDESAFARQVADNAKLDWITLKPGYEEFNAAVDAVVRAQEEPFAGVSVFMQYFVMAEARRRGIPVLLDGQGGDETLLGYERYFADYLLDALRGGRPGAAWSLLSGLGRNGRQGAFKALLWNLAYFHAPALKRIATRDSRALYRSSFMPWVASTDSRDPSDGSLADLQVREITRRNLPALLRYEDKNSMAHSIETRLPFLDYRLVELAISVPAATKLHEGWGKYLLRRCMEGRMPDEITWRRHKFGFEAPESRWMGKHQAHVRKTVEHSSLLREVFTNLGPDCMDHLNPGLRWRLYSVALWAGAFAVEGLGAGAGPDSRHGQEKEAS